jgi:hypothetical protein
MMARMQVRFSHFCIVFEGALAYDSGFPAARVPDALCNSRTLAPLAEGFRMVAGA